MQVGGLPTGWHSYGWHDNSKGTNNANTKLKSDFMFARWHDTRIANYHAKSPLGRMWDKVVQTRVGMIGGDCNSSAKIKKPGVGVYPPRIESIDPDKLRANQLGLIL